MTTREEACCLRQLVPESQIDPYFNEVIGFSSHIILYVLYCTGTSALFNMPTSATWIKVVLARDRGSDSLRIGGGEPESEKAGRQE